MDKPSHIFDRESEWASLRRFVESGASGATLGVVYGRRRQGKTFLLDGLCRATGGFYFAATAGAEAESLMRLGVEIAAHMGLPSPVELTDWYQAVDWLLALGKNSPQPVVVDEFPYLVAASPSLPSIVQRTLGGNRPERTDSRTRLLLCGSAISFMSGLLTGTAPLRGRAGLELVVATLDYRTAARFWGVGDPKLAVLVNSVAGGTPAYRTEFLHSDRPASLDDFGPWVIRGVLNRDSPLFREARHLLAEEPNLRDAGLYHSVLAAIAAGNTTRSGIASYLGRKVSDLGHPLTVLEDSGLLVRDEDIFRAARTTYRITEPLVAFYHAVMRPEWSRLDRPGQAERVWTRSTGRFLANVVGPRFEAICREWTLYHSEPVLGEVTQVGRGVVNDAVARRGYELDVVALGRGDSGRRKLVAIGEAKWGERVGLDHLARLVHVREILQGRDDFHAGGARLVLFSGAGFDDNLRAEAYQSGDVVLVDAARLYEE